MKKLFILILLMGTLTPFCAQGQQAGGTLIGALSKQGLAGAKLERRFGNHLFVPVSINKKNAALMIDTGSPVTVIDRNSVNTFGLTVEKTNQSVGGLFGRSWERYGTSKVASIAMGNCVITNVPVAIVDISGMNVDFGGPATGSHIASAPIMAHLNGILGTREMAKFGMIIDCTRQMLYVSPNGPSTAVNQALGSFLVGRGFTRVPMRLNANRHFEVEGALNEHPTRFLVDTGSATTLIDKQVAVRSGVSPASVLGMASGGAGGLVERSSPATVRKLAIGGFNISNAVVQVAHVSGDILRSKSGAESNAGTLGAEILSTNFAVIDTGGQSLYLRHPDTR